tara:strand:+ start:345 stop:551 length:207 start_codon:yes stop_codon:yes gene_type:complete
MKMKLYIANERGHTEMEVNVSTVIEQITDHPTHWVFVDGDMVMRENIPDVDWETVNEVRLQEAVVGGY